jgi:hypothetical protein
MRTALNPLQQDEQILMNRPAGRLTSECELLARCPAQHAVDHHVNGEAKPFVDISSDQLSGVGSNERKVAGR